MAFQDLGFTDNGVFTQLAVNLVIICGVIIAWTYMRTQGDNGRFYYSSCFAAAESAELAASDSPYEGLQPDPSDSLSATIKAVWNQSDDEILARNGLESVLFVLYLRKFARLFGILSVLCVAVLIPINAGGEQNMLDAKDNGEGYYTGFAEWTITNVDNGDWTLWIHLCVLLCISFLGIQTINSVVQGMFELKTKWLDINNDRKSCSAHSVLIDNLPPSLTDPAVLTEYIQRTSVQHKHAVFETQVTRNTPALFQNFDKRNAILEALQTTRNKIKYSLAHDEAAKRPSAKRFLLCGARRDVEERQLEDLEKVNAEIKKERSEENMAAVAGTGFAFVTFNRALDQQTFLQNYFFKYAPSDLGAHARAEQKQGGRFPVRPHVEGLPATKWSVVRAPEVEQVVWTNLTLDKKQLPGRRWAVNLAIAWLCIFWTVPVGVLQSPTLLSAIKDYVLVGMPPALADWLASIIIIVIVIVAISLIPALMRAGYFYQGNTNKQLIEVKTNSSFTSFLILANVIFPVLAFNLVDLAGEFSDDPMGTLQRLLVQISTPNTAYFLILVMQLGMVGPFIGLLNVGGMVGRKLKMKFATTDEDKKKANATGSYEFSLVGYPYTVMVILISLLFAITLPLTVPFGFFFFFFKWLVEKHQIMFHYTNPPASVLSGRRTADSLQYAMIVLIMLQIGTGAVLTGKDGYIQSVFCVLAAIYTATQYFAVRANLKDLFLQDLCVPNLDDIEAEADELDADARGAFTNFYQHAAMTDTLTEGLTDPSDAPERKQVGEAITIHPDNSLLERGGHNDRKEETATAPQATADEQG